MAVARSPPLPMALVTSAHTDRAARPQWARGATPPLLRDGLQLRRRRLLQAGGNRLRDEQPRAYLRHSSRRVNAGSAIRATPQGGTAAGYGPASRHGAP